MCFMTPSVAVMAFCWGLINRPNKRKWLSLRSIGLLDGVFNVPMYLMGCPFYLRKEGNVVRVLKKNSGSWSCWMFQAKSSTGSSLLWTATLSLASPISFTVFQKAVYKSYQILIVICCFTKGLLESIFPPSTTFRFQLTCIWNQANTELFILGRITKISRSWVISLRYHRWLKERSCGQAEGEGGSIEEEE